MLGTVKFFLPSARYGFIVPDDGSADVYFNRNTLGGSAISDLQSGQRVRFTVKADKVGKRPRAVEIELLVAAATN